MTPNELRSVIDFEKGLTVGQTVLVKWAGSFGHYRAEGTVRVVNTCSVRVALDAAYLPNSVAYPKGTEIVVPLITAKGNRWAHFNRTEPVGGYEAQAEAR
jgi:hypothetical protein